MENRIGDKFVGGSSLPRGKVILKENAWGIPLWVGLRGGYHPTSSSSSQARAIGVK